MTTNVMKNKLHQQVQELASFWDNAENSFKQR